MLLAIVREQKTMTPQCSQGRRMYFSLRSHGLWRILVTPGAQVSCKPLPKVTRLPGLGGTAWASDPIPVDAHLGQIVFSHDVARLHVNRPAIHIHSCLEPWLEPRGNFSRPRHEPKNLKFQTCFHDPIPRFQLRKQVTKTKILSYSRVYARTLVLL